MKHQISLLACALAATVTACGGGGATPDPPPDTHGAEITRTAFGVPHIKAGDESGLGYGIGYAYAQDNLCLLAEFLVTVNGERSKHFGDKGRPDPNGEGAGNLASDVYYKHLNSPAKVQASWDRQPAEVRLLTQGYVRGFNRYLREALRSGSVTESCRGQSWLREITELDLMRLTRRFAVEASGARFIDAIHAAQPPAEAGGASAKAARVVLPDLKRMRRSKGSNGVALGKDATVSGAGLLLANPHFPWRGGFRFYQMHLTIPGKVDVFGGALPGFPGINIGFNPHLAWTHTVDASAHFTLFALRLDPADPTRYLVDGKSKAMARDDIQVEVADGKGGTRMVTHPLYLSEHGPLLALPGTLDWTGTTAYALADANAENDRMAQQWWTLGKATSLNEFKAALEHVMGTPWVNTVATDAGGRTYFANVTPVPNVPQEKQAACVAEPYLPLVEQGVTVLDGGVSSCSWDIDPDAPQKGIFSAARLPHLERRDFVQNSNDSAWLTNPAQPLTGFARVVGASGTEQGGRTRIGLSQIADRLAGADGRPGRRFDAASLQQIALSNQALHALTLLPDLRRACGGGGTVKLSDAQVDLAKGCAVLAVWDGTANLESVGWPLFQAWQQALAAQGNIDDCWAVPFSEADPVHTPRGLRIGDTAIRSRVRLALGEAMHALTAQGIDYTLPWGQLQVAAFDDRRIPVHGGNGDGIYNAIESTLSPDTGQFEVDFGASLLLTVSFDGGKPRAEGFLSYSQSTSPASPHFSDQTLRFSAKQWIRYPFTPEEIAADPVRRTIRIRE